MNFGHVSIQTVGGWEANITKPFVNMYMYLCIVLPSAYYVPSASLPGICGGDLSQGLAVCTLTALHDAACPIPVVLHSAAQRCVGHILVKEFYKIIIVCHLRLSEFTLGLQLGHACLDICCAT